jgi:hypothetical protein
VPLLGEQTFVNLTEFLRHINTPWDILKEVTSAKRDSINNRASISSLHTMTTNIVHADEETSLGEASLVGIPVELMQMVLEQVSLKRSDRRGPCHLQC